jgi:hypothetical protein
MKGDREMSTQSYDERALSTVEPKSVPQAAAPSVGEVVAKAVIRGAAFGAGMALGGPVGGFLALIIFGGGDGDIDVGA